MEKELQKTRLPKKKVEKESPSYEDVLASRPTKKHPNALRELSVQLEQIATNLKVSVAQLLENAEHSTEFKEEYLEARKLACQIALIKR